MTKCLPIGSTLNHGLNTNGPKRLGTEKANPMKQTDSFKRELSEALQQAKDRQGPFTASFHGSSTIINDVHGRWVTGQVNPTTANKLAEEINKAMGL